MQTYPEYPMSELQKLERIIKELKEVLERDSKRHMMDEHLTPSLRSLLEEEIIPVLENELDWEPSDEDLGYGGEPPMTADEMHTAAWQQHQELHR
jgi:acyl carrier protein